MSEAGVYERTGWPLYFDAYGLVISSVVMGEIYTMLIDTSGGR